MLHAADLIEQREDGAEALGGNAVCSHHELLHAGVAQGNDHLDGFLDLGGDGVVDEVVERHVEDLDESGEEPEGRVAATAGAECPNVVRGHGDVQSLEFFGDGGRGVGLRVSVAAWHGAEEQVEPLGESG